MCALLAFTSAAQAQDTNNAKETKKGKKGPDLQQRFDQLSEDLKLTPEQKPKVKALMEEQMKKTRELRNDNTTPAEERRDKMRALRTDYDKKMKEILTPDQYEKWQKRTEDLKKKAKKKSRR